MLTKKNKQVRDPNLDHIAGNAKNIIVSFKESAYFCTLKIMQDLKFYLVSRALNLCLDT